MSCKTTEQILDLLRKACKEAGSQKIWAEQNGLSQQYVCDVLKGRREITDTLATKLGYKIVRKFSSLSTR